MTHIEDVLLTALTLRGKPYIFGYEINPTEQNPGAADCSELVQYACEHLHVSMVDGAANQYAYCQTKGTTESVDDALHTRGALMFITEKTGRIGHVVFSLGNGSTMEAKGHAYGCGVFSAYTPHGRPRFDKAARVPGVDYSPTREPFPVGVPSTISLGSTGPYVRLWTQLLHDRATPTLPPSDRFDAAVASATRSFQRIAKLDVDGIVGPKTWSTMFKIAKP